MVKIDWDGHIIEVDPGIGASTITYDGNPTAGKEFGRSKYAFTIIEDGRAAKYELTIGAGWVVLEKDGVFVNGVRT
jgi:hypothetical protein